ncbi:MAG: DUF3108 domain-containing protein [Bacteroidetes bacterium]|nr:DUF3108 domain-containing protein [Bacteroidota bacterium]
MNEQLPPLTHLCQLRFCASLVFGVVLYACLPWAISLIALAQPAATPVKNATAPFAHEEVLRYSVHWSFVRLGSIELRQSLKKTANGNGAVVQLSARSASGLPFIDVNIRDRAVLDPGDPRCVEFTVRKEHEPAVTKKYAFDRETRTLSVEVREARQPPVRQQRTEKRDFYDALGMIMLLRGLAGSGQQITVPMLMDFEIVHSRAECSREIEEVDVPAFDEDVPAYRIALRSSWEDESIGGLGGDIDFWCSADEAAIPLRAEMDLTLGSIVIELESCKRPGWKQRASADLGKGGAR